MKKFMFVLIPFLFLGCGKKDGIIITGYVPESAGKIIFLEKTGIGTPQLLDSARIKSSGKFRMHIPIEEPEFLQLGFNTNNYISLLPEPGEIIHIEFAVPSLPEQYQISGSKGSARMQILDRRLRKTIEEIDSLTGLFREKMDEQGFDSVEQRLNNEYQETIREQRKFLITFILNNLHSLASIKALYQQFDNQTFVLQDYKDLQYMKLLSDTLSVYYPESRHVRALTSKLNQDLTQYNLYRITELTGGEASNYINISLPTPEGDTISLSSFTGHYILLSFWASWDKTSVAENLNIKAVYNKYHSEGLEVFQVSFDNNKEDWKKAIYFDELSWTNVSDLSYPNSLVFNLYNIQKLPANYLLDKDGVIIAKDLLGKALHIKMEQLFKY